MIDEFFFVILHSAFTIVRIILKQNIVKTATRQQVPNSLSGESESIVTAYHEAGHILLAEWYGGRVIFASILPSDDLGIRAHGLTRALWRPTNAPHKRGIHLARVALAGPAAELIYTDEQYEPQLLQEWWTDWLAADAAIQQSENRPMTEPERAQQLSQTVYQLIELFSKDENWDRVAVVADHLEAHETLEEDQLNELRECGVFG